MTASKEERRSAQAEMPPIPRTTSERLQGNQQEDDGSKPPTLDATTVLYLAYGSNLCHQTFQGVRGIRPLSQINVSVPLLRLTLGLPGVPYQEPRFANVAFRKLPEKPPQLPDPPKVPPFKPPPADSAAVDDDAIWDDGLIGVVYEVTKEDYRQIFRTEGGGSGYKEIVVPCIPLPPSASIPEKPPIPELPKPFFARTLYAPEIPFGGPDDPSKGSWWRRMLLNHQRRDPERGQCSARYKKLLTDGAQEHSLPEAYQKWLLSWQPYTITTRRQQIGRVLLLLFAAPTLLPMMAIAKRLADEDGRYPPVMAAMFNFTSNVMWLLHDYVLCPLFGDGERTEEAKPGVRQRRLSLGTPQLDEEKTTLLEDQASKTVSAVPPS
jgi:hypothetical protein